MIVRDKNEKYVLLGPQLLFFPFNKINIRFVIPFNDLNIQFGSRDQRLFQMKYGIGTTIIFYELKRLLVLYESIQTRRNRYRELWINTMLIELENSEGFYGMSIQYGSCIQFHDLCVIQN